MKYFIEWLNHNADGITFDADSDDEAVEITQQLIDEGGEELERLYRCDGDKEIDIDMDEYSGDA